MSKPKQNQTTQKIKVIKPYKDNADDTWAQAYGFEVIEIPLSVIEEYGEVVQKPSPDILDIFESNLIKFCRGLFGI